VLCTEHDSHVNNSEANYTKSQILDDRHRVGHIRFPVEPDLHVGHPKVCKVCKNADAHQQTCYQPCQFGFAIPGRDCILTHYHVLAQQHALRPRTRWQSYFLMDFKAARNSGSTLSNIFVVTSQMICRPFFSLIA